MSRTYDIQPAKEITEDIIYREIVEKPCTCDCHTDLPFKTMHLFPCCEYLMEYDG